MHLVEALSFQTLCSSSSLAFSGVIVLSSTTFIASCAFAFSIIVVVTLIN